MACKKKNLFDFIFIYKELVCIEIYKNKFKMRTRKKCTPHTNLYSSEHSNHIPRTMIYKVIITIFFFFGYLSEKEKHLIIHVVTRQIYIRKYAKWIQITTITQMMLHFCLLVCFLLTFLGSRKALEYNKTHLRTIQDPFCESLLRINL